MTQELDTIKIRSDGRKQIKTENGWETYAVYVAKQNPEICGEWFEGCEVHHKDGNKENDDPNNLVCLTPEEHHKMHRDIYRVNWVGVAAFKDGVLYGKYPNIVKCSEDTDVPSSYIYTYLREKRIPKGRFNYDGWSFVKIKPVERL